MDQLVYIGHETDLTEWSSFVDPGASSYSRTTPGLNSTTGKLQFDLVDSTACYAKKTNITVNYNVIVIQFYIKVDMSIQSASNPGIFRLYNSTPQALLAIEIANNAGQADLNLVITEDSGASTRLSNVATLTNNTEYKIKLVFSKSTSATANDGYLHLYIDDAYVTGHNNKDIYTRWTTVLNFYAGNIDNTVFTFTGGTGLLYLDEFYLWGLSKKLIEPVLDNIKDYLYANLEDELEEIYYKYGSNLSLDTVLERNYFTYESGAYNELPLIEILGDNSEPELNMKNWDIINHNIIIRAHVESKRGKTEECAKRAYRYAEAIWRLITNNRTLSGNCIEWYVTDINYGEMVTDDFTLKQEVWVFVTVKKQEST